MPLNTIQGIILVVASLFLVIISRKSLGNPSSHGFFRFFAFETCVILLILNYPFWFRDPLSVRQLTSWILLMVSIVMVITGILILKKRGQQRYRENSPETFHFENTSILIKSGIYRFVRHPMYSSLLFLAWGAWLKHISTATTIIAFLATVLIYSTARIEEAENLKIFGEQYRFYISKTRMFIPYFF